MGPGEVQTQYVKLHHPTSPPDWGGVDWGSAGDTDSARLENERSSWGSKLTWIGGLMLIAVTVAFSVVVAGSPAPIARGDGDDTLGAMPVHHLSNDNVMRRSDTLAYDVTEIDWLALRSDLETLVSACQCGPVRPSLHPFSPSPLALILRCPVFADSCILARLLGPTV
jgi:hypothetical protein